MTPEKIDQLHSLLIEACDKHIANGGTIIDGTFSDGNSFCPISCLVGNTTDVYVARNKIIDLLGTEDVPVSNIWEFTDGFDGSYDGDEDSPPLAMLGQELRKKYIKGRKRWHY